MFSILIAALFATLTLAAATPEHSGCDVSKDTMDLPDGQTQLVTPTDSKPRFIGIGVGVQNYTCSSAGTFTSVGAVAEVFDISCLPQSKFNVATDIVNVVWENARKGLTPRQVVRGLPLVGTPTILGQHFFIVNPITGSGLSPKWDFSSASLKGKPNAFAVGARVGGIPAPSSANVDWLALDVVQGDLADHVFRIETRNGQPPASCTPGSADISVKYVSQYWFFGGAF